MILVAPTELRHAPFRALTKKGKGSGKPEDRGVDFAFTHKVDGEKLWYGIQRKEMKDFVASVNDGRLAKEVQQMCMLEQGVLVIEGTPRWDFNGNLVADKWGAGWTRQQHVSMCLSVQDAGVWVLGSNGVEDTAEIILSFERWVRKGEHTALKRRGPMVSPWGTKGNADYQRHMLMGLPGIDVVLADRILDKLGMIIGLRCTLEELLTVEGIGPVKGMRICQALETL